MAAEVQSGSTQPAFQKFDLVDYHQKKLDLYDDKVNILDRVLALVKKMGLGQRDIEKHHAAQVRKIKAESDIQALANKKKSEVSTTELLLKGGSAIASIAFGGYGISAMLPANAAKATNMLSLAQVGGNSSTSVGSFGELSKQNNAAQATLGQYQLKVLEEKQGNSNQGKSTAREAVNQHKQLVDSLIRNVGDAASAINRVG